MKWKLLLKMLFPTAKAYSNFILMLVFFLLVIALSVRVIEVKDETLFDIIAYINGVAILVSIFATAYFYNEWTSEMEKKKGDDKA